MDDSGKEIHFFRIDCDANNNPRADNMQVMSLDNDGWDNESHVTGIRKEMNGDVMSLVIYRAQGKRLYFMEVNFAV